jgi:hypothetical protein
MLEYGRTDTLALVKGRWGAARRDERAEACNLRVATGALVVADFHGLSSASLAFREAG